MRMRMVTQALVLLWFVVAGGGMGYAVARGQIDGSFPEHWGRCRFLCDATNATPVAVSPTECECRAPNGMREFWSGGHPARIEQPAR